MTFIYWMSIEVTTAVLFLKFGLRRVFDNFHVSLNFEKVILANS